MEDAERLINQIDEPRQGPRLVLMHLIRGEIEEVLAFLEELADERESTGNLSRTLNPIILALILNHLNDPVLESPEFVEVRKKLMNRE